MMLWAIYGRNLGKVRTQDNTTGENVAESTIPIPADQGENGCVCTARNWRKG
jgi:hypothetical protein